MIIERYDMKNCLLYTECHGSITINEIINYIKSTKNNHSYPRKLNILTNASKARLNINLEDLQLIVKENLLSIEKYKFIRDAIILTRPIETAICSLYQELSKTNKYEFQIFSTYNCAKNWLISHQNVYQE